MFTNTRFYILTGSILASGIIISLLRLTAVSDQLFLIRSEQVFGFLCLIYWYIALLISPLGYVIGKPRMRHVEFARRAIGVSAFYFAMLHAVISLWGQLGGPSELGNLPTIFQWSLLGGAIALLILGLMAATSLDVAVRVMTYRKWKWLHRFVYLAGVLAMLHVWSIGTHLAYSSTQIIAFSALVILLGLELFRITKRLNERFLHLTTLEAMSAFVAAWVIVSTSVGFIPTLVHNYHSAHIEPTGNASQTERMEHNSHEGHGG